MRNSLLFRPIYGADQGFGCLSSRKARSGALGAVVDRSFSPDLANTPAEPVDVPGPTPGELLRQIDFRVGNRPHQAEAPSAVDRPITLVRTNPIVDSEGLAGTTYKVDVEGARKPPRLTVFVWAVGADPLVPTDVTVEATRGRTRISGGELMASAGLINDQLKATGFDGNALLISRRPLPFSADQICRYARVKLGTEDGVSVRDGRVFEMPLGLASIASRDKSFPHQQLAVTNAVRSITTPELYTNNKF